VNPGSSRARRATGPSLRDRQREAVTAALLDAAEVVIAEKGMTNAGMAEIARRAGVAVGTLYNYFPDRDGLVRALVDTRRTAFGPAIRAEFDAASGDFETRLRAFFAGVMAVFEANRRFVRILYENDLLTSGKNRTVGETLRSCLQELLAAGVAERVIAPRDLDLRVRVLLASVRAIVTHALDQRLPFSADVGPIVELFLEGARVR
jgi:AcrR family transcriptional regulator